MISSRRLAREWALKILYQADVGKTPLMEAAGPALDRLRMEFVQRGARRGSFAEPLCIDAATTALSSSLLTLTPEIETAILCEMESMVRGHVAEQAACLDRALRTRLKKRKLEMPTFTLEAVVQESSNGQISAGAALSTEEVAAVEGICQAFRLTLADAGLAEMQAQATRDTAFIAHSKSQEPELSDAAILDARSRLLQEYAGGWMRASHAMRTQVTEWLRVACYTQGLVELAQRHNAEVDATLSGLASGWSLDRQAAVDRNILRMAALEMLYIPDVPASASINEAVELAKKYSTSESGRFVNGVLGALAATIDKAAEAAPEDLIEDDFEPVEALDEDEEQSEESGAGAGA